MGNEKFKNLLPGENLLRMQGVTQPKSKNHVHTTPCLGGGKMFKNGRTIFPVPILIEPGNRICKSTISSQKIPKDCLKIEFHNEVGFFNRKPQSYSRSPGHSFASVGGPHAREQVFPGPYPFQ